MKKTKQQLLELANKYIRWEDHGHRPKTTDGIWVIRQRVTVPCPDNEKRFWAIYDKAVAAVESSIDLSEAIDWPTGRHVYTAWMVMYYADTPHEMTIACHRNYRKKP